MRKGGKYARKSSLPTIYQWLRRWATGMLVILSGLTLITGLLHVDYVVRSTMLPGAPAILQGQETTPHCWRLEVLGCKWAVDLTSPAQVFEEARALLMTPPAPVRAGMWFWLWLREVIYKD